jgi:hypothetical protein
MDPEKSLRRFGFLTGTVVKSFLTPVFSIFDGSNRRLAKSNGSDEGSDACSESSVTGCPSSVGSTAAFGSSTNFGLLAMFTSWWFD